MAALARVWAAAVALDLDARRGARLRDRSAPSAELKALLTEPFVAAVISGAAAGAPLISKFDILCLLRAAFTQSGTQLTVQVGHVYLTCPFTLLPSRNL